MILIQLELHEQFVSLISFIYLHRDHSRPWQPVSMFNQPFSEEGIWKIEGYN